MPSAGEVIRRVREFRAIGQKELADAIKVSVSKLYRLERDDPRVERDAYARAANELGLRFDWKTFTIEPPHGVPMDVPEKWGVVRVPADVYAMLESKAAAEQIAPDELVARLIRAFIPPSLVKPAESRRGSGKNGRSPAQEIRGQT